METTACTMVSSYFTETKCLQTSEAIELERKRVAVSEAEVCYIYLKLFILVVN